MSEPERTDTYDKKYYEVNLPGYLEKDIKQLVEAKNREDIYYDKYIDEV